MAVVQRGDGQFVEDDPVEAEPDCVRFEPDQIGELRGYLLPRLESARDEVSKFVLREMEATWGGDLGQSVIDAIEHFPDSELKKLRAWINEARGTRIYAYVWFHSLFRLSYGLIMTTGGPLDEIVTHEEIRDVELESSVAPYWEFRHAFNMGRLLRAIDRSSFDEEPYVQVNDEDEYNHALLALDLSVDDSKWEKPGLYDFRDEPPTYSGSVEEYERESMRLEAEQTLDYMFQGDEWKKACAALLGTGDS